MDEDYRTINVHFVERYFAIDSEDAPILSNAGDAELEFYTHYQPTDGDIEEALQIGGYLVARKGSGYYRYSIELDY